MRVAEVRAHRVNRYLVVTVETDTGLVGVGETSALGAVDAVAAAVAMCREYLVGQDPLRIEEHWQTIYRCRHYRGSVLMGAISAIDIALWDIAGKHWGAPVHQLLGGPVRDRVRAYRHARGGTRGEILASIRAAREEGWTAVGHLTPWLDEPRTRPYLVHTSAHRVGDAIDAVRQYRELVGDGMDLCIEVHRRLGPAEAVQLAQGIAEYRPMFLEDPIRPDQVDAMAWVAQRSPVPIATGERLTRPEEFAALLRRDAVQYARVSLGTVGGITGARKVVALCEAHDVAVVPHSPWGPVLTAATAQVAAAAPVTVVQEYAGGEDRLPKRGIVVEPVRHDDNGYLVVPQAPGIGVEFDPGCLVTVEPYERVIEARRGPDGWIVDQ